MSMDRQNISFHCVNMYAVKDRVDLSSFSDKTATFPSHSTLIEKMLSVLPTPADDHQLKHNFIIHISRILATHMPFLKACSDEIITWHIKHDHYEAMSSQSEVVSIIRSYIIICSVKEYNILSIYCHRFHLVFCSRMRIRLVTCLIF